MTDATELDEAEIRARWTPPKREDFQGPGAEFAHSLALVQWSLSRGTEARTDLPAALDEITRLRAALDESEAGRARLRRVVAEGHIVRVAQVTPCSCSAQRARAVAAESALEAVRALVGPANPRSATAGSAYSTGRWDAFAEVRAALDGETEDGVFGDPDIHARLTRAALNRARAAMEVRNAEA